MPRSATARRRHGSTASPTSGWARPATSPATSSASPTSPPGPGSPASSGRTSTSATSPMSAAGTSSSPSARASSAATTCRRWATPSPCPASGQPHPKDDEGIIAYNSPAVNGPSGSFGRVALLGFESTRRQPGRHHRRVAKSQQRRAFRAMGATTRTSGSFAESRVRSSDCWVRSSISWVLVGSIVGSFVENRPKCAAIRYISNANGAYSGTLFAPMCRPALHNPRKCAAIRHIPRADVPLCDTRSVNSWVDTRVVISVRYDGLPAPIPSCDGDAAGAGHGRRCRARVPRGLSNCYVTVNRFLTFCHKSHGIGRLRAGLGSGFSNCYVTVNRFLTFCHKSHGIGRLRAGLGSGFSSRSGMGAPQHGLRPIGGQNVRDAICVAAPSKRSRRSTPPACPLTPAVLGAGGGAAGVRLRRRRLPPAGSRRNRGRGRAWRAGSPRASGRGQRAPSCGRPGRRAPRTRL
jgi:hypothetical protein